MATVSTESYKGVRDFYPEEKFIQNHIFNIWRGTAESFGYVEYDASILEPAELYRAKSSEEIVNEQTYTFTDRGDREVTLRPEMTPTVARMVAAREQQLTFPLRWYSIPNLFRYEKPQRGRLREHWQLNVDLFGSTGVLADAEIITIAATILKNLGAKESDFIIHLNNRALMNALYAKFGLDTDQSQKVSRVLDKKDKINDSDFENALTEIMSGTSSEFISLISSNEKLFETLAQTDTAKDLLKLIETLEASGISNIQFTPTLTRGFDYYTGMIFEIFDTDSANARSIAGGGRYDDLLDIFGADKIPTAGFGMGDVVITDFLATRNLLPAYCSTTQVSLCLLSPEVSAHAATLAKTLREKGINTAINLSSKKIGDQIKIADKQKIPYVIVIGEDEVTSNAYTLKELATGTETKGTLEEIIGAIKR